MKLRESRLVERVLRSLTVAAHFEMVAFACEVHSQLFTGEAKAKDSPSRKSRRKRERQQNSFQCADCICNDCSSVNTHGNHTSSRSRDREGAWNTLD